MDIGFITVATAESGDLAELARAVEAIGYESLWIPEHPVIPINLKTAFPFSPDHKLPEHYGRWLDPFIALTVAASATKRIKLGTCICLLPEREPLITAKIIASLDYYSGGRLILGVGAGWLKAPPASAVATVLLMWGIFTFLLWIVTFRTSKAVFSIFLLLWITFFLLAAGDFGMGTGKLGGYFGLLTGIDALLVAFIEVLNATAGRVLIPLGDPILAA